VRPEPGVGEDALLSRPGAVDAFERDPGAVEDERGGVAWECVWLAFALVVVVLEVAGLAGVLAAAGVCALAPEPPPEVPGVWLGCEPRLPPGCDDGERRVVAGRFDPVALPPRPFARVAL
jgi:hypothetical protein